MGKYGMGNCIGMVHTYWSEDEWQILNEHGELIARGIKFQGDAERIQDTFNVCLNLENPQEDIKKLVEELKSANHRICMMCGSYRSKEACEKCGSKNSIDEALSLFKEVK